MVRRYTYTPDRELILEMNKGGMYDISDKPDTSRTAVAQAVVRVSPSTVTLVNDGNIPKGNIFEAAKISANMAAKRAWDLLPYCHPISIDHVAVNFKVLAEGRIDIAVTVKNIDKTGVEMEALTGASIAALTIYDMLKPVDENLEIESIKLLEKSGGLNSFLQTYNRILSGAVLVLSDSRTEKDDRSGKAILERLGKYGVEIKDYKVLADERELIKSELVRLCDNLGVDIVITTGGTGVGPRDVTPEATASVIQKRVDGISEALRTYGQRRTPLSMLSRSISGVRGHTVIINLPGSARAVRESLDSLFPGIMHIFKMIEGHGH
ncbi:MAG TPA: bifunctional molybdenum cofactor biosynthesis protein MoaC/MoaB [Nitrososphaeraceae archaeon]|nr:bifunctional molybdenum cofactor biosynthesis protein MoaC/MoaB [Nitrososphaeraceae archaeon]